MVFWSSLRRLAHIIFVIIKHALAQAAAVMCSRQWWLVRRLSSRRLSGPERLRLMFEDVGGTFIKFGQMLALQPDILALEYCNELFNLLDRVTAFDVTQVKKTFVEELKIAPSEIFDHLDEKPLATASIGQVHVGYIGGRKLAVKVQRPSVEMDFAGDIRLISATIRLIKFLRVRALYWMIEPMSEFIAWTHEELDYRCEAHYMEQLRRNAEGNRHERVPTVLWQYTTRRTLVSEFFEGETLLAYLRALETGDELMIERLRTDGFEPELMARNIINNFLEDVFRHGMFHADLHPANLMILPGNAVGYIDFGITGTISKYSRQNLIALTLAYTRGDLAAMCDAFFKVSVMDSESSVDKFRARLERLATQWYEKKGKGQRLRKNFTLVMLDMLRLSRETGVWPERDVIKYIRSAIAIDGLITRFAPAFDLGQHLQTACDRQIRWAARRAMFSYEAILAWTLSSGHIMRDGPHQASTFIHRIATGELHAQAETEHGCADRDEILRRRATQLCIVVFVLSLLMTLTGERVELGINMFTAEAMFVFSAAAMLLRTLRRLV